MYYVGRDESGIIIGLASAPSPLRPWTDKGTIVPPVPNAILESPITAENNDFNYLFINLSYVGEFYRTGSSPIGPR